jgi:fatty-acyl-CoA synthase
VARRLAAHRRRRRDRRGRAISKIVDRIKDVVKTGGEWVSSLDIEDIILRMPSIAEVASSACPTNAGVSVRLPLVV